MLGFGPAIRARTPTKRLASAHRHLPTVISDEIELIMNAVRRSRLSGAVVTLTVLVTTAFAGATPANATGGKGTPLARDTASTRVWFHPGETQSTASDLWSFDNTTSTGSRRSFLPTSTASPVQTQYPFTYQAGGTTVVLAWTASGDHGRIVTLGYTTATDVMVVTVDGRQQSWYGCQAANRPDYARAAC
jgi:hypothetical protein